MHIGVGDFTIETIRNAARNNQLLSFDLLLARGVENPLSNEETAELCKQAKQLGATLCKLICGNKFDVGKTAFILECLKDQQINCQAVLTGSVLTTENIRLLHDSNVEVHFFAGYDDWQHTLELLRSGGYAAENAPSVKVLFLPERGKNEVLLSTFEQIDETFAEPVISCMTVDGRLPECEQCLLPEEVLELEEKLQTLLPGCMKLLCSCSIDASGKVYGCAAMDIVLGDIREKTLEEIVLSSKVLSLHREHPRRVKDPCAECAQVGQCTGCAARAYRQTGDFMAADPYCPRNADKLSMIQSLPVTSAKMLPHADSMLLIDRIIYLTELYSVHEALIRPDNPLLESDGTLAPNALVEYAAQAAALRDSVEKGGKPSPGLLCEVSKVKFFRTVKVGDILRITVRTEYNIDTWYGIGFEIASGGEIAAQGVLKLCIYDDMPLPY